ncbi:FAD:protein FMN transferase [Sphingomonas sp. MMS24-JH45]
MAGEAAAEEAGIARFAAMGTRVELHLFDGGDADALAAARAAIEAVDDALNSIHRPSPATALNDALLAGREARIENPILHDALVAADAAYRETMGMFDVAADERSGATWDSVSFDADRGSIAADRPLALDFGGLGKGLALDRAVAVLRDAGVRSAPSSAGESSIAVIGEHPLGGRWPFAIPHPLDEEAALASVELYDEALSISATVGAGVSAPDRAAMVRPGGGVIALPCCTVAIAATGAAAEAMSTALVVADEGRARRLLHDRAATRFRFVIDAAADGETLRMSAAEFYDQGRFRPFAPLVPSIACSPPPPVRAWRPLRHGRPPLHRR